jgi:hypothetical protein
MHLCPVCGYGKLRRPPEDFLICPRCGTEFGYHDASPTPDGVMRRRLELRELWIARGAHWHSRHVTPPPNWPREQQQILATAYAQLTPTTTVSRDSVRVMGRTLALEPTRA